MKSLGYTIKNKCYTVKDRFKKYDNNDLPLQLPFSPFVKSFFQCKWDLLIKFEKFVFSSFNYSVIPSKWNFTSFARGHFQLLDTFVFVNYL